MTLKGYSMENDYINWTDQRLNNRLVDLAEINQPWQCNERREQIQREMGNLAFECSVRYAEAKNEQIEEAWSEHGK